MSNHIISLPDGLHRDSANLVRDFAMALGEKLRAAEVKYGYGASWKKEDWQAECIANLVTHLGKGDPRDVAAFCAFAWHHGWSVSPLVDDFGYLKPITKEDVS